MSVLCIGSLPHHMAGQLVSADIVAHLVRRGQRRKDEQEQDPKAQGSGCRYLPDFPFIPDENNISKARRTQPGPDAHSRVPAVKPPVPCLKDSCPHIQEMPGSQNKKYNAAPNP